MGEKLLSRKEMGKISGEIYICLQRLSAYYVRGKGKLFSRGEYKGKIFFALGTSSGTRCVQWQCSDQTLGGADVRVTGYYCHQTNPYHVPAFQNSSLITKNITATCVFTNPIKCQSNPCKIVTFLVLNPPCFAICMCVSKDLSILFKFYS